ncbi:ArsR/SmtB family transcription factor [Planctomycetaceae bacterium SH139]
MSEDSEPVNVEQCAVYLKALADPTRLRILKALQAGPLTVSDVAFALDMEIGLVSHHLRTLYHAQIATSYRDGKYVYYAWNGDFSKLRARGGTFDFGCCQFQLSAASNGD